MKQRHSRLGAFVTAAWCALSVMALVSTSMAASVTVTGGAGNNNSADNLSSGDVQVTIWEPLFDDLQVQSITVDNDTPEPGQTVTVSYTIRNAGNQMETCNTFANSVRWSGDDAITTGDPELGSKNMSGMAGGASQSDSIQVTIPSNAAPGTTYYVGLIADSSDAVSETDGAIFYEDNNTGYDTVVVIQALPGDLNGDGAVGFLDFVIMHNDFGSETISDLNGDGIVDSLDLPVLLGYYETTNGLPDNVLPMGPIVLSIDTALNASIVNTSAAPVSVSGYSIVSPSGSLGSDTAPSPFGSQLANTVWVQDAGSMGSNVTLNGGQTVQLGPIIGGPLSSLPGDLQFRFGIEGQDQVRQGAISTTTGFVEVDEFEFWEAEIELIHPSGIREIIPLRGPTTVHVFFEGSEGDADDDNGNGRDEVETEIVSMNLTGNSSLGPLKIRLNPDVPSGGLIEENQNNNPGLLDVDPFAPGNADSFFDVFFEIEIGGQVFHPELPRRLSTTITHKPPKPGTIYTNLEVIQLLDPAGNPTGFWIGTTIHEPNPIGNTLYVDANADGANNGTSWTNAFVDLQDALASAADSNQIWIAAGIYYPDEASAGVATGITNNQQDLSFRLVDGTGIYGGFAGGETNLAQRNVEANVTVLSGDIDQNDSTNADGVITNNPSESIVGSNSYNVVRSDGTGISTLLDGVTITAGKAPGGGAPTDGGCLNTAGGDLHVRNCTISGGWASYNGGGVYVSGGTVVFSSCIFVANHGGRGGAVSALGSTLTFRDSEFNANTCSYAGAGIYCQGVQGAFERCSFMGNSASVGGGYGTDNFNPSISFRDCLFSGNRAAYGGGLRLGNGSNELVNCTVAGNFATETGGGIYASDGSTKVHNSIIWHNGNGGSGLPDSAISIFNTNATTRIAYSAVEKSGESAGFGPDVGIDDGGNIPNPPLLVDTNTANYRLQYASPCINAGTNLSWMAGAADLDGNTRIFDGTVDMGAYEAFDDGSDSDNDGLTGWDEGRIHGTDPDNAYSDSDTMNDGDEIIAGTNPLDPASIFAITDVSTVSSNVVIQWSSASNRTYAIWGSSNLLADAWSLIEGGIPATPPDNVYVVALADAAIEFFKIAVE